MTPTGGAVPFSPYSLWLPTQTAKGQGTVRASGCEMKQCLYCERVATHKGMCHAHYMRAHNGTRMDRSLAPQYGQCSATGCDRPASERGMCHSHARRARRGAPIDDAIRERRDDWPPTCTHEGCDLPTHAKGLCRGHYSRLLHPPSPGTYRYWESGMSPEWWRALRRMAKAAAPRQETPWDKWCHSRRASFLQWRPAPSTRVRRNRSTWQAAIRAMCRDWLREEWKARRDHWDHWCERRVMSFGRQRRKRDDLATNA
jgi:hypothetical protein